ncbi:HTTM domain-containing protein [Kribbella jejuensis]|uniref:Vitamin K-dependent gamma-carboxylase-like protein n=1 Tax=Kribbella jejuensis TaxID=236068 RepID=A0A542E8H1_9ACTN|nr:HTTM domain-containing protein [Kribbella jejuensis]TQJ11624.1 vitamin K-dependent gamma-carboxylase-like protein [Kribbella jejuensis]
MNWFLPPVPIARIAWLRTILYLFVILDMHAFVNDTLQKGRTPELYQPLFLARLLELPRPSVPLTYILYVVLIVACLVGATNRLPRLAGWIVAPAFTWWVLIGMSDGKVDHDHLALVVALWVLPTAGRARYGDLRTSDVAGWAVKCIQIAVVATYALSALAKIRSAGWAFTWPGSSVLTWAIVRRPNPVGERLLGYPWLLHILQWIGFIGELLSPAVLWLKGRKLSLAALFFLGFHAANTAMLGIHFLPTVVCWLAFAPLERLGSVAQRRAKTDEVATTT